MTTSGTFDPIKQGAYNPAGTDPTGQTLHGDHAYVFYQVPVNARKLPLVFWHGHGQSGKTWETTPDGREGFQNIFLRRLFSVYLIDQPRRGRAGRSTQPVTIAATPDEQLWFGIFRLGAWPSFYPGVQFSRDPEALNQFFRQMVPNTGPYDPQVNTDAVSALFDKICPAILFTHSQSGGLGWRTALKNEKVRAIVAFEPAFDFPFPQGDLPPPMTLGGRRLRALTVSDAEFTRLTKIPIVIYYGDNIPEKPSVKRHSWPMRRVAAEARRVLLEMGSEHLGAPVDQLTVSDAVVTVKADPAKRVTYGELIAGKKFNVALTGNNIDRITGQAKTKSNPELKYAGHSAQRDDIPPKVDGSLKWAVDVKLPGTVHARNVKPPFACGRLTGIDESSVKNLPGFIKVLSKGNYVAVVCEREEQAIRAARQLKTTWQKPATAPFPTSEDLFNYMRSATPVGESEPTPASRHAVEGDSELRNHGSRHAASGISGIRVAPSKPPAADNPAMRAPVSGPVVVGNPDAAFSGAARIIEAEYQIPFQGHTAFAGAHALADPSNGQMTVYTNDMKSYSMRRGIATFLGMPHDSVRVVWMMGPQGFGRSAAEDAAFEAAWIAREIGRPVRMQWMRDEETAWDTKGPAFLVKMRGALDSGGGLVGYDFHARSCDHNHVGYNEPDSVLIAQLMGMRRAKPAAGSAAMPSDMYAIPNRKMVGEVVGLPMLWETPLRTGNLRDPNGPQPTFAAESFIDEAAAAAKIDPLEFRIKMLKDGTHEDSGFRRARSIAVLEAAAKAYGWDARPSPTPISKGNILTGRGIAYSFRGETVVAQIAEVEVNRETGHVWAKRLVCAHDCGFFVNPASLRHTIECCTLHGLSRALCEEVRFDTEKVTSRDWFSYQTLRHEDIPERIDILLVNGDPNPNRPDLPPYGVGEASLKPMLAAIGNAIYDATGVRIRRVPFRKERVLAALKAAGV